MKLATRILLATLVSPLAVLVPIGIFAVIDSLKIPNIIDGTNIWFFVAFYAIPISYVAITTIGLSAHFLLQKRGIRGIWPYVLIGSVVSLIPGAMILLSNPTVSDILFAVLVFTCAIAASLTFGAIVKTPL